MITEIALQHFKCFELLKLPLHPLTLLSGSNASGKSSILQALVLLHQTMREQEWSTRLMLNGTSIQLGTVSDIVDKVHGRHSFNMCIEEKSNIYKWVFSGERSDMSMKVDSICICDEKFSEPQKLRHLLPVDTKNDSTSLTKRLRGLTYITAERLGPREVYSLEDRQSATVVGPCGEHAISLLHWGRDEQVIDDLTLPNVPPKRLRQIEKRMNSFFPGCALNLAQIPNANAITLGLRTSEDTSFHRPIHVGFGLTQLLPIIIAALSASKGDILLIENPEVHLHPAGQAQVGQFLAEVASAGIQVIIETHSDHILNGIRRAVKSSILTPESVALHFFRQRSSDLAQVETPIMDDYGNLDFWPSGFFDQFDKDLNYFAGWEE